MVVPLLICFIVMVSFIYAAAGLPDEVARFQDEVERKRKK